MYASINYKTKKALKEAVNKHVPVAVFSPGYGEPYFEEGSIAVEGPWYPEPHKWYAQVVVKNGYIVEVK